MTVIYNFIYALYAVFYFPYLLIRGKWHKHFNTRFGRFPGSWTKELGGKETIWIHAVSVGEVLVVSKLIDRLKAKFPDYAIVCSTVTETGNQLAFEQFGNKCLVIYSPLDFSWIARRFIKQINPKIYISAETEIWPNLYTVLAKHHVPIIQINGRISDKAFKGYNRVKFLTKKVLSCVSRFYMQSPLDADRIRQLGAPGSKVKVSGNLKFDIDFASTQNTPEGLGFKNSNRVLVAGSTHPGEEKILLNAYRKLNQRFDDIRLILAPRHIERTQEVAELVKKEEFHPKRLSDIGNGQELSQSDVIIVDTIGRLRELYGLSQYVFVGKSLAVGGGQNMIEPAYLGKPTIVGPMTQNFKDTMHILRKSNAILEVSDEQELTDTLAGLMAHKDQARMLGEAARKAIKQNQGATEKTIEGIAAILNGEHKS